MPAYHSQFSKGPQVIGNTAVLPFKTQFRGPAPKLDSNSNEMDIVEEALYYFKANVFFRTYEIKSEADRLLIYLTLYISECLKELQKCPDKNSGQQKMYALAISRFDIPGDPGFPLNAVYGRPGTPQEADFMRQYLTQLRQETGLRLCDRVYSTDDGRPSKWWVCFARRRFMDKTLTSPGTP
ncbi:unnamed protein product [Darwinula stevensoni]|uniref:Actin-related protein 2/3 complex subunit 3 n=1 Tax=Darwinula stevensoni TaxID=69355 RepID=A0A7R8XH24_9CRUS|nr:unnamed protein product [Darwinula stevensoni]CAG0892073.1 unnamed protein product [Darwinula stevensoni]